MNLQSVDHYLLGAGGVPTAYRGITWFPEKVAVAPGPIQGAVGLRLFQQIGTAPPLQTYVCTLHKYDSGLRVLVCANFPYFLTDTEPVVNDLLRFDA
jgi:hypothetical protein